MFAGRSILCLSIANSLGMSSLVAVPLWVGLIGEKLDIPAWGPSMIASAQLAASAIANIAASSLLSRFSPRRVGQIVMGIAALSYLLCAAPNLEAFIAGALGSGASLGALLAIVTATAARTADAHRTFSFLTAIHIAIASVFYALVPIAISDAGVSGLFMVLCGMCVMAFPTLLILPIERLESADTGSGSSKPAGLLSGITGLIGFSLVLTGYVAVFASAALFGKRIGLSETTVSHLMAIGSIVSIAGPLAAAAIGQRFGTLLPIILFVALLALCAVWLSSAMTSLSFLISLVGLMTTLVATTPFISVFLSRIDSQGRWVAMSAAFIMIGSAFGPSLSATILSAHADISLIGLAAALIMALAMAAFVASAASQRFHSSGRWFFGSQR